MSIWLDVVPSDQGWTLHDTGQLGRIVQNLPNPRGQYPSLVVFIGSSDKSAALKTLFPQNNTQRRGLHGISRLHIDSNRAQSNHPILFADVNVCNSRQIHGHEYSRRSDFKKWAVRYTRQLSFSDARLDVLNRLVIPFSHMIYIFADDFGGPRGVYALLSKWVEAAEDASCTSHALPGLVIIFSNEPKDGDIGLIDERLRNSLLEYVISSLVTLDLRGRRELSPSARYEPLKSMMMKDIELSRELRIADYELYSAKHLEALFSKAATLISQHPDVSFDMCKAAREDNPVPSSAAQYLNHFVKHANQLKASGEEIAIFIASALIMDAYPPHMHRFNPRIMFSTHYKSICLLACEQSHQDAVKVRCREIELHFCRMFTKLRNCADTSAHRWNIAKHNAIWAGLTTSSVCPDCLLRGADFVLPCGHTTCSNCVRMRGDLSDRTVEYEFALTQCILCDERFHYIVNLLPPTARPLLFVLDGGGVRGAITLAFLREIEARLCLPLWKLPHLTVGTSAGGLIGMEIICRRSSASVAQEKFQDLAHRIFPFNSGRKTAFGSLWNAFRSWVADGRYNSNVLNNTLRDAFGSSDRFFGSSLSGISDRFIVLTASQVEKDGKLGIFTNYRRLSEGKADPSYSAMIPPSKLVEPLGWQVARCIIAALGYFTPYHIDGIGTMQDGGICANCPLRVAIRESHCIWPDAGRPDLILSLGTGISRPALSQRGIGRSGGFVKRGIRTFLYSPAVDPNEGFQDTLYSLSEDLQSDVLRLNLDVEGNLPDLDDTTCMKGFLEAPYTIPDDYIQSLAATSFFFELDQRPEKRDDHYHCVGSILYLRGDCTLFLSMLQMELPDSKFIITPGTYLGSVAQNQGCEKCGYYRKNVSFSVQSLTENIQLAIHSTFATRRINGFPITMQSISRAQKIDSAFGVSYHATDWRSSRACYCVSVSSKRPREESESDDFPAKKRKTRENPSAGVFV